MRSFSLLLTAGVLASGSALAADMPGSWAPPPAIALPVTPLQPASAWYVRGDIGYGVYRVDRAISAPGFPSPTQNDVDKGIGANVGVGYKSQWLRTDVTLDYTGFSYSGAIAGPGDVTAKVSALTGLFNGYLDLGTWYCLTPYVGAGLGGSWLRTYDYSSAIAPPFVSGLSNTQWKFAWALMAGTAISFTRRVSVDLNYRYLNLGDVTTASDAFGAATLKNLAAHQVRVGVRWSFDGIPFVQ